MKNDEILFGPQSLMFFELSPYYYCNFVVKGIRYRTIIHYWCTSYIENLKHNRDLTEMIRSARTADMAMNMVKKWGFRDFNDLDPKEIILPIQERINQCDGIRNILMCTGESYLRYRGVGYLAEDNKYGRILMRIRDIYNENK